MVDQHIIDLYPDTYNNVAYIKREIIGTELYLTFKNANVKIDSHFLDMANNSINNVSRITNIDNISFVDSTGSLNNLKTLVFNSESSISGLKNLNFIQSDSNINNLNTLTVNRINFSSTNSMLYDLGRMNFSSGGEKSILNVGYIKSFSDGLVYDLNGTNITYQKSSSDTTEIIKFYNNGDISCNNLIISGINNSQTAYSYSDKKLTIYFDKGLVTKEITVDSDINTINFIDSPEYSYGSQVIIHINPSTNTILKGKEDLLVQINGTSSNGNQAYINFDSDIESSNTENTSILITATNFSSVKFFLTASLLYKK